MNQSSLLAQRRRRRSSDDEMILPLINVVFLLLIFFMVAGQLSATDAFPIDPAESASEGHPDRQDLLVLVAADGRLAVGQDEVSDVDSLVSRVREGLEGTEDRRVRVKADGAADANRLVAVMERLRAADVQGLELLTTPEQ